MKAILQSVFSFLFVVILFLSSSDCFAKSGLKWSFGLGISSISFSNHELTKIHKPFSGINIEVHRMITKDLYLCFDSSIGWQKNKVSSFSQSTGLAELSSLIVYRNEFIEIGTGPLFSRFKTTYQGTNNSESALKTKSGIDISKDWLISGMGWECKIKYRFWVGKKMDISVLGVYTMVHQDSSGFPDTSSSRFGFMIEI